MRLPCVEELELLTTLADCSSIRDVEITACMRGRIGGYSEEGTPVPIPNTVVKLFSSDDTVGAAPWENKTSPSHPPTWAVFLCLRHAFQCLHQCIYLFLCIIKTC